MRLSDIMSHAGLTGYAIVAMILFMLVFAAIVWRLFRRSHDEAFERARRMPLDDDAPADPDSEVSR